MTVNVSVWWEECLEEKKFHYIQGTEEFWHQLGICYKSKENHQTFVRYKHTPAKSPSVKEYRSVKQTF